MTAAHRTNQYFALEVLDEPHILTHSKRNVFVCRNSHHPPAVSCLMCFTRMVRTYFRPFFHNVKPT